MMITNTSLQCNGLCTAQTGWHWKPCTFKLKLAVDKTYNSGSVFWCGNTALRGNSHNIISWPNSHKESGHQDYIFSTRITLKLISSINMFYWKCVKCPQYFNVEQQQSHPRTFWIVNIVTLLSVVPYNTLSHDYSITSYAFLLKYKLHNLANSKNLKFEKAFKLNRTHEIFECKHSCCHKKNQKRFQAEFIVALIKFLDT